MSNIYIFFPQRTLGRSHPALFQAASKVMLMKIPGRQEIIRRLSSCTHGDDTPQKLIQAIVEAGEPVHESVSHLLTHYGLPV